MSRAENAGAAGGRGTSDPGTGPDGELREPVGSGPGGATDRGHEVLPHTADLIVSAWAPTLPECVAEAMYGLVSSFAEVPPDAPRRPVPLDWEPAAGEELLIRALDEVIYLLDVDEAVPAGARLHLTRAGGLAGELDMVPVAAVCQVGPAPKAITRHGLRLVEEDGTWRCAVTVDV